MITMEQFIADNKIEMDLVRQPYVAGDDMINYVVTLKCNDAQLRTKFHTGTGWIEDLKGNPVYGFRLDLKTNRIIPSKYGKVTQYEVEEATRKHRISRPGADDVLDSLKSDAGTVVSVDYNFESWAEDMGFDPDSRKAYRIFRECAKMNKDLKEFLGYGAYDTLMNEVEPL